MRTYISIKTGAKIALVAVCVGMFGGISSVLWYQEGTKPVVYAQETTSEPREVRIEVRVNWTQERIKQEILAHLPPIFVKIAGCESTGHPNKFDKTAYNPASEDYGILQVNKWHWGEYWESRGLDAFNPADNVQIAKHIYEVQGLQAWEASEHCWSK